jgi:hypothetical protein
VELVRQLEAAEGESGADDKEAHDEE